MTRTLSVLDAALLRFERISALLGGVFIFTAMALTMAEVIGRRLFNAPIPGFVDLFDIGMAGMALLGMAYCQALGGHVRMDLMIGKIEGRARWCLEAVTAGLACWFIFVVAVFSFGQTVKAWRIDDVTVNILLPLWPAKAMATTALLMLAARLGVNCAGYVRLVIDPRAAPVGVPQSASVASAEVPQ